MAKTTTNYPEQTRKILNVATVLFAGLALAAGLLMNSTSYVVTHGYMVRDQIASQLAGKTVFTSAVSNIMELQVRWPLIVLLAFATIFTALKLTRLSKRYNAEVKNGLSPLRWIGIGVLGALMVQITALLSGITDVMVLKLLAGFVLLSAVFTWLSEVQNKGARKPSGTSFTLGLITGLVPIIYILVTAINTYVFGMIRAPWYVYALYAVILAGFTLTALTRRRQLKADNKLWKDGGYVARRYELITTVTLVLFSIVLIVGLLD